MLSQAEALGANAVVNVGFTTSQVANGAAELYAYGTAVMAVRPAGGPTGRTLRAKPRVAAN